VPEASSKVVPDASNEAILVVDEGAMPEASSKVMPDTSNKVILMISGGVMPDISGKVALVVDSRAILVASGKTVLIKDKLLVASNKAGPGPREDGGLVALEELITTAGAAMLIN